MSNARINSDDKIKARNQSCRLGKISKMLGGIEDIGSSQQFSSVVRPDVFLKTDKTHLVIQKARQHTKWNGSVVVVQMFGIT